LNEYRNDNKISEIICKPNLPNNIEPFVYNIEKARKDLQWTPKFRFKEMLYDIEKEMQSHRFDFLIEKRKHMFTAEK
jgi:nucleoside-diphosphate-sugar epimerase